ncbi:MAG: gliding motility lipoprotein GldH, partial [Phaeodactylibacter sp.]|nr:gliding motility lipoprotein GldH [Phaeodactylibacter sp.]
PSPGHILKVMKYSAFFLFAASLTLFSCGPGYDYEKQYIFEEGKWAQADTLNFSFPITDTLAIYNLYLEVEHSTAYGYQNLYTKVYTAFPSGERIGELLSLELADKAGTWLGDCSGKACALKVPIQEGAYFNQAGQYTITVEQYMRVNPVEGIRSIGFLLEDTGQQR